MQITIRPLGTRHGLVLARFLRDGHESVEQHGWYDGTSRASYTQYVWRDGATTWHRPDDIEVLTKTAKGKRKAFEGDLAEVVPPAGMTHCTSIMSAGQLHVPACNELHP